jgi:hypothetical protein
LVASEVALGARTFRTHLHNIRQYRSVANPYASIWISPADVHAKLEGVSYRFLPLGTVLDGDWDLQVSNFTESPKYRGLVERFEEGLDWEDTSLFKETFALRLQRRGSVLGMHSLEQLARYYRNRVDPLYEAIRVRGFSPASWRRGVAALYVHLGRGGEIIGGSGGNHRLAIAKILNLETMPVRVQVRHQRWQAIRDQVASGGIAIETGLLSHPDLTSLLRQGSPRRSSLRASGADPRTGGRTQA